MTSRVYALGDILSGLLCAGSASSDHLLTCGLGTDPRDLAMSSRDLATGFNDTMRITLSMMFSVVVVAVLARSAAAYRGWFRVY